MLGWILAPSLLAELPVSRLWTVYPPGGQRGKETEVAINGVDLDWPEKLQFSHPGIIGKPKSVAEDERQNLRTFQVSVGSEVPDGIYEVRSVGRFGISNPRPFAVGKLQETILSGEDGRGGKAKSVGIGTTVYGRVPSGEQIRLRLTNAPRDGIQVFCRASQLDSRLEPVLLAHDDRGRELARNRRGGWLKFDRGDSSEVTLTIHDLSFRGGDEYFFQLSLGIRPNHELAFPPVMSEGGTTKLEVRVRGGDGGSGGNEAGTFSSLKGLLATGRSVNAMGVQAHGIAFPSIEAAAWARTTPYPVIRDESSPGHAQRIQPPCEVAGRFDLKRKSSEFEFDAKKGETYEFEVFSQRLGMATDPHLVVQRRNADGSVADEKELADFDQNIGGHEFNTSSRDSYGKFEVKGDGTVRVVVSDLARAALAGDDPVYGLRVRKESPDFTALIVPVAPPPPNRDVRLATVWSTHLRQGERVPVQVFLRRTGGLTNAVRFDVEGPPGGLKAEPLELSGDRTGGWLMLESNPASSSWQGEVQIIGRALGASPSLERRATPGMVVWNVGDANNERVWTRLMTGLNVSVSGIEPAALRMDVEQTNTFEVKAGAKVSVPLRFVRAPLFDRAIKVKPTGLGALDGAKELEVAAKTNAALYELDLGQSKLAVGEHLVRFEATSTGGYRRHLKTEVEAIEAKAKEAASSGKKVDEELKLAKEAAGKAEAKDADALKSKVKELESRKEKLAGDSKKWLDSVQPQDQTVRAWSGVIRLKVVP